MPFANYIYEYADAIRTGRVTVGKWIDAIYRILIAGLQEKKWYFDAKKANKAIKFIENFCHHSEGRSDLLKLELWQKAIVSAIFGIVDAGGFRQFREVFIMVARKNGKTLFAAEKCTALPRSWNKLILYMTHFIKSCNLMTSWTKWQKSGVRIFTSNRQIQVFVALRSIPKNQTVSIRIWRCVMKSKRGRANKG